MGRSAGHQLVNLPGSADGLRLRHQILNHQCMSETQAEPTTVAPSPTIASPPPPAAPAPAPDWMSRFQADLLRRLLIIGALSVLVMIGLFFTNFSHLRALYYWSAMFPIFGLFCLWHELIGPSSEAGPAWKDNSAPGVALARADHCGADKFPANSSARADGRRRGCAWSRW